MANNAPIVYACPKDFRECAARLAEKDVTVDKHGRYSRPRDPKTVLEIVYYHDIMGLSFGVISHYVGGSRANTYKLYETWSNWAWKQAPFVRRKRVRRAA